MIEKIEKLTNLFLTWGFIFLMFYISCNPDKLGNWCGIFEHYNTKAQIKLDQIMKR